MLATWRATVFWLTTSSTAIDRLVMPVASRASTCNSRVREAGPTRSAGLGHPLDRGEIHCGPELAEHPGGGVELEHRTVLVGQPAAGVADSDTGSGRLVRGLEVAPGRPRRSEDAERGEWISLGEQDEAHRVARRRPQHGSTQRLLDLLQLVGRASCGGGIANRQHDLDVGGQQVGPRDAIGGLVDGAADRRRRNCRPALRQPEPGQTGLGISTLLTRSAIGLLGSPEVATEPVQLGLPVQRVPRRAGWPGGRDRCSQACSTSCSALDHAPLNCRTSARCTRHCPRYGTRSGWDSHHRLSAAVHSLARRTSNVTWQNSMTVQYASPATTGDTSPAVTPTITMSKQATPSC